jgi:IclR family transcriptional regulator, KDG regulon repressor
MQEYKTLRDLSKILLLFDTFQFDERSVTEISKHLNMLPSKVSRILATIEKDGFLERNPQTNKYRLGIRFFELGMVCIFHFPLRKIIRPHVEQIARELGLTSSWAVLRSSRVIVVDRFQNMNIDSLTYRIGLNIPLHSTSIGKILLAYLPEEEQARILQSCDLLKFTDATCIDKELIKKHLEIVKRRGYSTDEGETHPDLNCIGAPIRDDRGDVIAAINVMDEKSRTSLEKLLQLIPYLQEKALFISRQLGYSPVGGL